MTNKIDQHNELKISSKAQREHALKVLEQAKELHQKRGGKIRFLKKGVSYETQELQKIKQSRGMYKGAKK